MKKTVFAKALFLSVLSLCLVHIEEIYSALFPFLSAPVAWAARDEDTGLEEITRMRPGIGALDDLRQLLTDDFKYVSTYRFFDQGYTRLKNGDLKGAARDFRTIIEKDPDNTVAPLCLAHIESRMGRRSEATRILKDYLSRFGENGYVHLSLAFLYLDGEKIKEAMEHFKRASVLYKGDVKMEAAVRANLGDLYLRVKEYEKALNTFLTLTDKLPSDGLLSYKIGLCLKALHRYKEALPYFKTALTDPDLTATQKNACLMDTSFVLLKYGLKDEAIAYLKEVMEKTEKTDDIHILARSQLVNAYFYDIRLATDKPRMAEEYLRELISNDGLPRGARARARMELAFLLIQERRFKEAEATLERALDGSDLDAQQRSMAIRNLIEVKYNLHKLNEALSIAESVHISSSDTSLLLLMAECNVSLKRYKEAESLFLRVSSDRSTPADLRYKALTSLGNLYLKMGRLKKARSSFKKIIEITPDDTYALKSLMEIAKRRRRTGRFLYYARRVAEKDKSTEFQAEVAATMAELGRPKKALSLFRRLLKKEKSREYQAEIYKKMGFLSLKLEDRESAVNYFRQNLALSKGRNPQILKQLSDIHIHEGECSKAIPLLRELAHARKGFEDYVKLARCLDYTGDGEGAAENYHAALKIRFDPDAAMELVLLKEKTGETGEAIQVLTAMLQKENLDERRTFTIFLLLSKYYGRLGNGKVQKEYARKALERVPEDVTPAEMVYPLVVTGTSSPILKQYERTILTEKNPEAKVEAAVRLANLYESVNNLEKAQEFLTLAMEDNGSVRLRFKRGVILYQRGRFKEAQGDFLAALETEPQSSLYLALIFDKQEKPGLAIDLLENFLNQKKDIKVKDRARLLEQLAYLYSVEGQTVKALKTVEEAMVAWGSKRARSLMIKARCLNLLDRSAEAMDIAGTGASEARTTEDNALFHQIMGDSARIMGEYHESNQHYLTYLTYHEEDASAYYSIGINSFKMNRFPKSRACLQKAISLDPESPSYLSDYGFVLSRMGEEESAIEVFERYLEIYPYDLSVLETTAYANMRECHGKKASAQFKDAIDMNRLRLTYAPEGEDPGRETTVIDNLKKEVLSLEKEFSFSAYLHRMDLIGSDEAKVYRGTIPSELGFEAGWRPPIIGFRNQRIFEVTGRILGSFENESWAYDKESTQLALGFRYKPFIPVNFFVSFERLIKVGDNSEDNWLLRGMVSECWGRDPRPESQLWHSGSVYLDYGAFLENRENRLGEKGRRNVFYGEIKDGILFPIHKHWGLSPHGIVDFHWDDTGDALGRYLEGGFGLEILGWLHETEYAAHDWRLSFFVQYKWGSFRNTPPGEDGKSYHGPVIGLRIIH